MNTKWRIIYRPAIALITMMSISFTAHSKVTDMNNEQLAVLKVIKNMTDAFNQKNIQGVMSSYEPQAGVAFEPNNWTYSLAGIEQEFLAAFHISPTFSYPNDHQVIIVGDLATHTAHWTMEAVLPDGQKIEDSGLSVATLRKQKDGRWLIVMDNPHSGKSPQ